MRSLHLKGMYLLLNLLVFFPIDPIRAQSANNAVPPPLQNDFAPILSFLASDWLEGREADARGGFMAADYIASMFQLNRLLPFGDRNSKSYFQDFSMTRNSVQSSSLAVIGVTAAGESVLLFTPGTDYQVEPVAHGLEGAAPVVFAGYGIEAQEYGYDDYEGVAIKNRFVVILDGYPGHADSASGSGQNPRILFREEQYDPEQKVRNAAKHGAAGVIFLNPSNRSELFSIHVKNQDVANHRVNASEASDPGEEDGGFSFPGDTGFATIPCFRMSRDASLRILSLSGIDPADVEKGAVRKLSPGPKEISGIRIRYSVSVTSERLAVRNVLGMVRGLDTTRYIIIGAHYDHLGTHNGLIFNGADDNASGVAGMIALSGKWAACSQKPACNILFAAWTAEEKGIIGSGFFARNMPFEKGSLALVINMDMISRNAPEDSTATTLSIGTLPSGEELRNLAREYNSFMHKPFILDLWDVSGHSGSDYAHFAAQKIPIMTFFSGFHEDYHSPRDIASKTDPGKMERVLRLVNDCIAGALKSSAKTGSKL